LKKRSMRQLKAEEAKDEPSGLIVTGLKAPAPVSTVAKR